MINKKTKFCKAAALLGAAVMMISAMAGCGKNTKVVLTAGLKKNEVFRISSASCVLPEVMVYLTNMQNQYESVYGSQIWNASDGQLSLEQEEREQVLTQLARIKVMNLLAQKKEVTLDDKEKERAAAAGREYFTSLNSAEVTALNVTQDLITKMYEEYALAEKVYQTIVENVNPEVSDDEARTITVDMIRVSDSAKASQVLGKAKEEGVDFETLAQAESEDQTVMQSFGKGEVSEELEKAAFNLGKDEISDVVESDYGYHIILRLPVDASNYHDDWISEQADALVMEGVEAADVSVSDDISSLDIASFYQRYMAYSVELLNNASAEPSSQPSADPSSQPSDGT